MSNTIDSERIAKDIIFLESDSSRGNWDVEEWEAKILSRYPVLQERVATAAGWIQMLIAEAVAAECLEIGQMLDSKADEWSRKAHADPRPEHDPRAMAMHDAYREAAHLVYARAGEGEQVPMSDNPNCAT